MHFTNLMKIKKINIHASCLRLGSYSGCHINKYAKNGQFLGVTLPVLSIFFYRKRFPKAKECVNLSQDENRCTTYITNVHLLVSMHSVLRNVCIKNLRLFSIVTKF